MKQSGSINRFPKSHPTIKKNHSLRSERGSEMFEKQAMLVLALTIIFVIGNMVIPFTRGYWQNTVENGVTRNGGVESNFGELINWD